MKVGQHQLVNGAPVVYYNSFKLRTYFIIQDLHVKFISKIGHALHDQAIGSNPVFVISVIKWCLYNGIRVTMICDHYVLVSASWSNWKAAAIIWIKFTDWWVPNMQLCSFWWEVEYTPAIFILVRPLRFPLLRLRVEFSSSCLITHLERIGPCGLSSSQLLVGNTWTRLGK